MAKAHTNPDFLKDVLAARAEYAKLKGLPAGYDPVSKADVPHGEDFLNMPVDTASYRYAADVLRESQLFLMTKNRHRLRHTCSMAFLPHPTHMESSFRTDRSSW